METGEITTNEVFKDATSSQDIYLRILGRKELPKFPEDMPSAIFLPSETLGSLEEAILRSDQDGKERSQTIGWSKRKTFTYTKVFVGTENETSNEAATLDVARYFFSRNKHLLCYHTHPKQYETTFSIHDVASNKAYPRGSFIFVVGSGGRIAALFQTEKTSRLPIFSLTAFSTVMQHLEGERSKFSNTYDHQVFAELFESEGFGYYIWKPPKLGLQQGD